MPDLINLIENIYAGNVDSAPFDDVHEVIHVAVFFQVDVGIVYSVL